HFSGLDAPFVRSTRTISGGVFTITVSPDGGRGAYGWCSINEIWNVSGEKYRENNLCAEDLDRPIVELTATLLHEMAHLYNLMYSIQNVTTTSNISVINLPGHHL